MKTDPSPRLVPIEDQIARLVVQALLDAGHAVRVTDGVGETLPYSQDAGAILAAVLAWPTGTCRLHTRAPSGWVLLLEGNGADLISDYTMGLDSILQPALDACDRLG